MQFVPNFTSPADEIVKDQEVLSVKSKMMNKMRTNSMLNSISRMATFIAGVMIPVSLIFIAPVLKEIASPTVGAVTAALGSTPIGLGFLAVAAVATAVAVGADYTASRIWQAGNFDGLEINARSTAKHLVEEIKANNLCLQPENPTRADGKSWTQVVTEQKSGHSHQQTLH